MSMRKLKLFFISTLLTVLMVLGGCATAPQDIEHEESAETSSEPLEGLHDTDVMHKSREESDDMERLD